MNPHELLAMIDERLAGAEPDPHRPSFGYPTLDDWQRAFDWLAEKERRIVNPSPASRLQIDPHGVLARANNWSPTKAESDDRRDKARFSVQVSHTRYNGYGNTHWTEFARLDTLTTAIERARAYRRHQDGRHLRIVDTQENIEITNWDVAS